MQATVQHTTASAVTTAHTRFCQTADKWRVQGSAYASAGLILPGLTSKARALSGIRAVSTRQETDVPVRYEPRAQPASVQATPTVACQLQISFNCVAGEVIKFVGSDEALGSWDAHKAPALSHQGSDVWARTLMLPPGLLEFKAVVYSEKTKTARWELIPNRTVLLPSSAGPVSILCQWGSPKVELVATSTAGQEEVPTPLTSEVPPQAFRSQAEEPMVPVHSALQPAAPPTPTPQPAPAPVRPQAPAPAPAPPLSPEALISMAVFERQVLGLLQRDPKGMPLELLLDLLQYTTTNPRFDSSPEELEAYLAHLQAQGAVAWEPASQQWRALRKPTPPAYTPRKTSPKPSTVAAAARPLSTSAPGAPAPALAPAAAPSPSPPAAAANGRAASTPRVTAPVAAAPAPAPAATPAPAAASTSAPAPVVEVQALRAASPPLSSTPRGPRVAYPAAGPMATWVVNEEQLFGLLANFSALSLDRLQSLMQTTMVEPQYTRSLPELADYLAELEGQGFVAKDSRGWYSVARVPALPSAAERPPSPRPRAKLPVSKPSDFITPSPARIQPRAASPVPVSVRVPTPQPSGAAYPAALRPFAAFETQVLGLVSNFQSIPLERLHSVMTLTMVSPRFDRSTAELDDYLDWLVDQGQLSRDEQGWYAYTPTPSRRPPPRPTAALATPSPATQPAAEPPGSTRPRAPVPTRATSPTPPRSASVPASSPAPLQAPAPAPAPAPLPAHVFAASSSSLRPLLVPAVVGVPASAMPPDVPIWWPADQVESYRARSRAEAAQVAAAAAAGGAGGAGAQGGSGELTSDQKGLLLVGAVAVATMVLALAEQQEGKVGRHGQGATKAVVQQQLRK